MTNAIFITLYGLLFLSGMFMLPAWIRVARDAYRQQDPDYALVATALAINSAGTILVFGARLAYGFESKLWQTFGGHLGATVLVGLAFFEISKTILMVVRHRHGERKAFIGFALVSALWALFAIGWTF